MHVPLSRPDIGPQELLAVNNVLSTDSLSMGPYVQKFEESLAALTGHTYGIAVNSGTSGLHLLIKSYSIADGDEVITTPFSFVASSNAMLYERAVPKFVDIDADRMDILPEAIAEAITPKTKAIMPVDVFGQPAKLKETRALANHHGLNLIEDSCESLGAHYYGQPTGHPSYCDAAVFAFYPNKQITTGEGGVIVTSDPQVAKLCRSMRNQGRGDGGLWLSHERLGYNYRLDEMSAALGVAQLQRLDEILQQRQAVADQYTQKLSGIDGLKLPYTAPATTRMSWFVYVIRVDKHINRDKLMLWLVENGISCRPYFTPIHLQPFYRKIFGYKEGDFPITEQVAQSTIAIPFFNTITTEQIDYVVHHLTLGITLFGT